MDKEEVSAVFKDDSQMNFEMASMMEKIAMLSKKQGVKVIAIDGRSASGKTTLAKILQEKLGAGVVHMDDFFLPQKLRSEERLREPGGNIHYERFGKEVLAFITSKDAFSYGIFDCSTGNVSFERRVRESSWRIVEGVYSHHPNFADYADLKIYLTVDPAEQLKRIAIRNGPEKLNMFQNKWIPMEEAYFRACKVREKSDIVVGKE